MHGQHDDRRLAAATNRDAGRHRPLLACRHHPQQLSLPWSTIRASDRRSHPRHSGQGGVMGITELRMFVRDRGSQSGWPMSRTISIMWSG